jgi:hypothetical protein
MISFVSTRMGRSQLSNQLTLLQNIRDAVNIILLFKVELCLVALDVLYSLIVSCYSNMPGSGGKETYLLNASFSPANSVDSLGT